jgi:alpha-ketoglutarate-dependent taurine dioxygenase
MHQANLADLEIQRDFELAVMNKDAGFPLQVRIKPEISESRSFNGERIFLELWSTKRPWLDSRLLEHGAIVFRGFGISTQEIFQSVMGQLKEELLDYVDGDSPRTKLGGGVYTSTEYAEDLFIPLHNELSYSTRWPARLFFCCVTPPQSGGQTPLISSRALLQALPSDIVSEFRKRKVRYVRNLHGGKGTGKSWQETFETDQREDVDRFTANSQTDATWNADRSLRLTSVRAATSAHPVTGDEVWFNQADQFHPSSLPASTYESIKALYEGYEDELPENATFGDGAPIPLQYLQIIRDCTRDLLNTFDWQQGDLLMVDNVLVAHGRMPFQGPRKILVAMTSR